VALCGLGLRFAEPGHDHAVLIRLHG